mgnify:CR=1 FL=1
MKSINKITWLIIILSILGIFDTSYLTAKHYLSQTVYCPVGKNCETVLNSVYSTFFGIPLALFGALFYFLILILTLLYLQNRHKIILQTIFSLTLPALIVSITLTYLQLFVLRAICVYCVFSAFNILLLSASSGFLLFFKKNNLK